MPALPRDPIALARENWVERGWAESADAMALVTSVMRVQQILLQRIESTLRSSGLSFARFELLRLLAFSHEGRLPLARIRAVLQVHPASVTNAVDRLVSDDLVRRETDPDDGRAVIVQLTAAGRERVEQATPLLNAVFAAVELEPAEIEQVTAVLAAFRHRAGDFAEAPEPA